MNTLLGFAGTFIEHPWVALAVFLAVMAVVFGWLSGGDFGGALAGIRKVIASFFTAPFIFLKRAMGMFSKAEELEAPYVGTKEHLLYIANRFNYLWIVVGAVILLSGGIASSLISLYPKQELAEQQPLRAALDDAKTVLSQAEKEMAASNSPGFSEQLKAAADSKKAEHSKATAVLEKARASLEAAGQGLNLSGAMSNVLDTTTAEASKEVLSGIDSQVEAKCGTWNNFDPERCAMLKQAFAGLGEAHQGELKAREASSEAENAYANVAQTKANAEAHVSAAKEQVKSAQAAFDEVSVWKFQWLKSHLMAALTLLFAAFGWVIAFVWAGAIFAEIMGWIILMMLSLEKKNPPT